MRLFCEGHPPTQRKVNDNTVKIITCNNKSKNTQQPKSDFTCSCRKINMQRFILRITRVSHRGNYYRWEFVIQVSFNYSYSDLEPLHNSGFFSFTYICWCIVYWFDCCHYVAVVNLNVVRWLALQSVFDVTTCFSSLSVMNWKAPSIITSIIINTTLTCQCQ